MVYGDFKDLSRKSASDKVLSDKAWNIAKNKNMMDISMDLHQWFINLSIKNLLVRLLTQGLEMILKTND